MYDLLILNGKIISGMGNPWYFGDLAIAKGKIVRIGQLSKEKADRVIDARGCFVAPGFIDGHSHSDLFLFSHPEADSKILQGVTTEIVGMDGLSVAPIDEGNVADWQRLLSGLTGDLPVVWKWRSLADYLRAIDAVPVSVHVASYVGLGTIRLKVMGMTDREAAPDEIDRMKRLAAQSLEEVARGISGGLVYPPNQYQTTKEIVEIAKVVREYDGIFDVHLRNEGDHLVQAMDEAIEIGRQAQIPVLISHFKVAGKKNWGQSEPILQKIDEARREGVDLTISQYPYTAGSTMLHAVVPPWYHAGGPERLIQRIREERERIKKDLERDGWDNLAKGVGWESIVIASVKSDGNKKYEGKRVTEIAAMRGIKDPIDAALDLLVEEDLGVGMLLFSMDEKDVVNIMRHPSVNFITDGLLAGKPHPRTYGTFPRILGRFVREKGILSLEEAIRKMTSLPAEKMRLKNKGKIIENGDADITVFNLDMIRDHATYENPRQSPAGIEWVIVNGTVVAEKGKPTHAKPGKTIKAR
ncbi:MAG: D-aminoacylase [Deltaproteobacteria bacterium]|nr:MAG: D-aminoacylase [Deltaproteobacteria bacterium]